MPNQTVTGFTPLTPLPGGLTGLDTTNGSANEASVEGTGFGPGLLVRVWNTGASKLSYPNWTGTLSGSGSPQTVSLTCNNQSADADDANDLTEVTVTVGDSVPFNDPDPVHEESVPGRFAPTAG
jgi:hypothetical protein